MRLRKRRSVPACWSCPRLPTTKITPLATPSAYGSNFVVGTSGLRVDC